MESDVQRKHKAKTNTRSISRLWLNLRTIEGKDDLVRFFSERINMAGSGRNNASKHVAVAPQRRFNLLHLAEGNSFAWHACYSIAIGHKMAQEANLFTVASSYGSDNASNVAM